MKYLENFGFLPEDIDDFKKNTSNAMLKKIDGCKNLIQTNLYFLKELGIKNIKELFIRYYELFMMDHSNFIEIFNKYDREDLVEKLEKNAAIIEYL